MTTGSVVRDDRIPFQGDRYLLYGNRYWKDWQGTDRPGVEIPRVPPVYYETIYNGRKYRFRDVSIDTRPPKRARDVYHPYSVQESATYDAVISTQNGLSIEIGSYGSWTAPNVNMIDSNDEANLINKIYEQVKGSQFNAAVSLGEGREVLGMIAGNAIRIAKGLHHLKRGDVSGAMRSLLDGTDRKPIKTPRRTIKDTSVDNLSSYWLELQYGWLPLLGDVKAGAEFLAHQLSVPLQETYHASIYRKLNITVNPDYPGQYGRIVLQHDVHIKRIRAVISEKPSMAQQLGLLDPLVVAWELLPFSFVVDWFLPIGNWLEARASVSALKGSFYRSESKLRNRRVLNQGYNPNPPYTRNTSVMGEMGWSKSWSSERFLETQLKVPLPAFKPLSKSLSVQHCLNAIALLAGFR